jgi:hypothetical protein
MIKPTLLILALAVLIPMVVSLNAAEESKQLNNPPIELTLNLSATADTNNQVKVSGDLLIKNTSTTPLSIQSPQNRRVLAFLVFDPLGNPLAPVGLGKSDPGNETHPLPAGGIYKHHFKGLDFVTGSALLTYDLSPGKTYRVIAVYRPAGPNGPGYTSQETNLAIPIASSQIRLPVDLK